MKSADPISDYLPHLDFMIAAIQESRFDTLNQPYADLDRIYGALYGAYVDELKYLAVGEPQNRAAARIAQQFEVLKPELRALHDALSLSEYAEALEALKELKELTRQLFSLFGQYQAEAAQGPSYSEIPYSQELIRVGRHYLDGALGADAVHGRLEIFCQYHELLEQQVTTMIPSPPERKTFEERMPDLEEALALQLQAIEDLDLALERDDDEGVSEALELIGIAAESLVDVYRALEKADLEPRRTSCIRCGAQNPTDSRLCDQCHAVLPQQAGLAGSTIALEEDGTAVSEQQFEEVARLESLVEEALAHGEVEELRQAVEQFKKRWAQNQRRFKQLDSPPGDTPPAQVELLERARQTFEQAMTHLDEGLHLLEGGLDPINASALSSGLERLRLSESFFRGLADDYEAARSLNSPPL